VPSFGGVCGTPATKKKGISFSGVRLCPLTLRSRGSSVQAPDDRLEDW
jgi:hypothetical protein